MKKREQVYLSLGTNLGNRQKNISKAVALLNFFLCRKYDALSETIETKAVGFDGPDFLNCVARYTVRRSPESLLRTCKRIERLMGRRDAPEYDKNGRRIFHDRIIDIDILYYGNLEMSTPELTIPHPRLKDRPFFDRLADSISKD